MFLILFISQLVSASIRIVSPESLKLEYFKGIKSSLGNFGNPPYNTKIRANLWYPMIDRDGCNPITFLPQDIDVSHFIFMFDRGNCSYAMKVKHAQDVGVRAVIIANNIPNQNIEGVEMRDNGIGGTLLIPALMISKEDADRLKQVYIEQGVELLLGFELPKSKGRISLSLVLSSGNLDSQSFISGFYEIGKLLNKANVDLEVHFVVIECLACKNKGFSKAEENCLGGGRYCAPDPDEVTSGPLTGRDVMQEDLRQMCLLEVLESDSSFYSYSKYFEFQKEFVSKCFDKLNVDSCSEGVMKKLQINVDGVNQCVKSSFGAGDKVLSTNGKLDEEIEFWRSNGLHLYPAIILNHQTYKGSMDNSAILNGICAAYYSQSRPEFCKYNWDGGADDVSEGYSTYSVVFGNVLFFGVLVAILFVYRHVAKKELQKEMRQQVNAAVNQYFALNELSTLKQSERQSIKSSYV